jgi:Cu/Ag efflux pump CusA
VFINEGNRYYNNIKRLPDNKEISNLRDFASLFHKRVNTISKIVSVLILLAIIILMLVFWERYVAFFNAISLILGLLGVGLLAFIKWIQNKINSLLLSILVPYVLI